MNQHQLLQKFAAGATTSEDHEQFNAWFHALSETEQKEVLNIYETAIDQQNQFPPIPPQIAERIKIQIQAQQRHEKQFRLRTLLSAAAAVLLLVIAAWWLFPNNDQPSTVAQTPVNNEALPGKNGAILTLADGTHILLDSAGNGVVARQGQVAVSQNGGLIQYENTVTAQPLVNTLSTPRGRQFQLVLPDGSKVWLNAASSITYPTAFTDRERQVTITGEVYFEVAKSTAPFKVAFPTGTVEVLGTHFNIMAYSDEEDTRTTLLEGVVKMNSTLLKPGQQAVLTKDAPLKVQDANTDLATAWINNRFQFSDTPFGAIMRQVSRWYDVDVQYDGPVPFNKYTADLSRNTKLTELLKVFELSGFRLTIEGKTLRVKTGATP